MNIPVTMVECKTKEVEITNLLKMDGIVCVYNRTTGYACTYRVFNDIQCYFWIPGEQSNTGPFATFQKYIYTMKKFHPNWKINVKHF